MHACCSDFTPCLLYITILRYHSIIVFQGEKEGREKTAVTEFLAQGWPTGDAGIR